MLSLVRASKRQAGPLLEAAAEATILLPQRSLPWHPPASSQASPLTAPCDEALEVDASLAGQTSSEGEGFQLAHPQELTAAEA